MGKKRNVDAENHLLTGGLITGFLTFMGSPVAIVGAGITGALIKKDIKRGKKEEVFQKKCEKRWKTQKKFDNDWLDRKIFLEYLGHKFPRTLNNRKIFEEQEKMEELFKGAKIIWLENKAYHEIKTKDIFKSEEFIKKAKTVDVQNKIIVLSKNHGTSLVYLIIKIDEQYFSYYTSSKYPYNFRKRCEEMGIPFKYYNCFEYSELEKEQYQKMCRAYRLDLRL